MRETQYTKILDLHAFGDWVCGNAYRAKFIFSAHKRRQEMIDMKLCAGFEWKPCEHGFANVRDYKMREYIRIPIIGEVKNEKVEFYNSVARAEGLVIPGSPSSLNTGKVPLEPRSQKSLL